LNKVLAECLHRNMSQRYKSINALHRALEELPPMGKNNVFKENENAHLPLEMPHNQIENPIKRYDYLFWMLAGFIGLLLILLLTTNIFSYLFGGEDVEFQITGFASTQDSTIVTQVREPVQPEREATVAETGYGQFREAGDAFSDSRTAVDPRRVVQTPATVRPATESTSRAVRKPENMVFIESNTFGLGRLKENLHHNVSLSGFYISKYEITQAEWNRFMRAANVSNRGDNIPVDNISWFDAVLYANGLSEAEGLTPCYKIRGLGASRVVTCDFRANGYRLPTEAEWEFAAKAGKLYNYSGSEDPALVAWFKDNSAGKVRPGGQKEPNDFGLYDMTGNVAEWCWDWYDANYPRTLTTFVNPTGPETGTHKSIRGGNVQNGEGRNLNILYRDRGEPGRGYLFVGFRLVRAN
ncbi:MAG: SUMF1/EgtB/PvdO family nonheme iron enzyme, partial [Candidatus Cloacimonadaceae bacterium]|nr:SUMF1/EgtB/PvdO family nonheme iron enzyme [Candidatus Cloacimonadaceae bacterium]